MKYRGVLGFGFCTALVCAFAVWKWNQPVGKEQTDLSFRKPASIAPEISSRAPDSKLWKSSPKSGPYVVVTLDPKAKGLTDMPELVASNRKGSFPDSSLELIEDTPLVGAVRAYRESNITEYEKELENLNQDPDKSAKFILHSLESFPAHDFRVERVALLTIANDLKELSPSIQAEITKIKKTPAGHAAWGHNVDSHD